MNHLHRRMGTFALTMVGLSSIIGSEWLFGSEKFGGHNVIKYG